MDLDFKLLLTVTLWCFALFFFYVLLRREGWIKGREGSHLDNLYHAFNGVLNRVLDAVFDVIYNRWQQRKEYTNLNPRYWFSTFIITRAFTVRSFAGFQIRYELDLICKRKNPEEFKAARMLDESVRQKVAEDYHEKVFCRHFDQNRYFFRFGWRSTPEVPRYEVVRTPVAQLVETSGITLVREILHTTLNVELYPFLIEKNGCELQLGSFRNHVFPDHLIEENHAMISNEELKEVEDDDRYGLLVERIAVVALKRRLEFLGKQSNQKHETDIFSLETEKAGRVVRIRWKLKSSAPSGYELVGYRKTGGFNEEIFDPKNNGVLVVHAQRDGEVIETLANGESYFYTFYLRSERVDEAGARFIESPLRFQLAVSAAEELAAIEATLARIEARKPPPDPDKEHISRALKEFGLYVGLDNAFETATREGEKEILSNSMYSAKEKRDKIERLRDAITTLRSKYEP